MCSQSTYLKVCAAKFTMYQTIKRVDIKLRTYLDWVDLDYTNFGWKAVRRSGEINFGTLQRLPRVTGAVGVGWGRR